MENENFTSGFVIIGINNKDYNISSSIFLFHFSEQNQIWQLPETISVGRRPKFLCSGAARGRRRAFSPEIELGCCLEIHAGRPTSTATEESSESRSWGGGRRDYVEIWAGGDEALAESVWSELGSLHRGSFGGHEKEFTQSSNAQSFL